MRLVSSGFGAAINATDNMRAGTLLGVGTDVVTISIGAAVIFLVDAPAWSLPAIIIAGSLVRNIIFVGYFGTQFDFRLARWLREVIWPVGLSLSIVVACAAVASWFAGPSLWRLLLVAITAVAATTATIRYIVSTEDERGRLIKWLGRVSGLRS